MFRVGRISVRFPGKLLLALTVLVTVSIVLARPAAAWDETFSKNLATTILGMGCSDVNSYATTTDLATSMLKAIPDSATPAQVGMSGGDWNQSSPVIDQIKADPGIIGTASSRSTTQCADLAKLLRYGNSLSQGTTPTPQTGANSWLAKLQAQIDPLKSGWIDTICKDSLDTGCRAQAEQTIAQLANACSVVDESNRTPTTIKSYDDLKNCANKNNDYLKSQKDACTGTNQKWDDTTNTCVPASADPANTPAQCTGGVLGWVLCPLMQLFNSANNFMAQLIEGQLKVGPLSSGEAIYEGTLPIWQTMVGVANLILVIGFLVVIFSQATSLGLSAYGIKKMLPRIIAAAILINLSFFICQIALDIVNVIGASIQGILNLGASRISTVSGFKTDFGDVLMTLGGIALGTYAVISGALAFLVPVGLSAILAILIIFLGLALRKILIVLLIIVAPLAFAAMILPGTEGLFKKWYKSLGGLLVMYPVVMAIMYGSVLLSKIILASGGVTNIDGTIDTSGTGNVNIMLAYAVVALGPTVGTYMFIKSSSKIFGAVASGINKAGAGLKKRSNEWAKEKQANSQFSQARAFNKAVKEGKRIGRQGNMEGNSPIARYNRMMSRTAGIGNAAKFQRSAINKAAAYNDKIHREDTDNAAAQFEARGIQGPRMVAIAASGKDEDGRKLTTAEHAAAIEWTMKNGKLSERMQVYGAAWANQGDNDPDTHRLLQTARAGYFAKGDNQFMGVSYAGLLAQGKAGGKVGVQNAMLSNAIDGKIGAETGLDNDYMDTIVDIYNETSMPIASRNRYDQIPTADGKGKTLGVAPLRPADGDTPSDIDKFRENIRAAALATLTNDNTSQRVKEEFRPKLEHLAGLEPGSTKPKPATPPTSATP